MQFLYPKVLWALLTLAIPIIIHLFNFRRYKTVYFSHVSFLQNIRKETKSRSNFKNILILLARLLALAFLVLVFARPYIPAEKESKVPETSHVALYIDNSFSMDAEGKYGILLEAAKIKAKEITQLFPRNTKYLLVTNEFLALHHRFVSSEQLIDWVSQIRSTHIVRNLHEVVDKISVLLPKSDSSVVHNVFILSDFQKNLVQKNLKSSVSNCKLYAVPFFNQAEGNLFVDSVWFESPGHYVGKQENLYVKIKNNSSELFHDIPVQLFINDSIASTLAFSIDAKESKELVIPFTKWNSGFFKARVEINDYPITFDNSLFFDFEIDRKKRVLLIDGANAEDYLRALYTDDENIEPQHVTENNIPYNTFQNYQVIILNELVNLSSGLINEVVAYANQGGTVAFIPSLQGVSESYNLLLSKLQGIQFEEYVDQEGSLTEVDLQHELLKTTFNVDLTDVRFPNYKGFYPIVLQQKSNVNPIFKSETGLPLFVQSDMGKGAFYISALSLNSESTDFGTHPLFVPLFYNLALYSSSPSDLFNWIKPGLFSIVKRNGGTDESMSITEVLSGKELKPNYNLKPQEIIIHPEIDKIRAGHYKVNMGGIFQNYVSYNFDRSESALTYFTMDEVKELFTNSFTTNIQIVEADTKNLTKTIKQQTQGKPLSILFLWLALTMLIIEMVLLRFLK